MLAKHRAPRKEETRAEQALFVDGVMEMMDQRHYVAWAAKPKNGCIPPDEAYRVMCNVRSAHVVCQITFTGQIRRA